MVTLVIVVILSMNYLRTLYEIREKQEERRRKCRVFIRRV